MAAWYFSFNEEKGFNMMIIAVRRVTIRIVRII